MAKKKSAAPSVRSTKEKAKESLNLNSILMRLAGGLAVLLILAIVTRPEVWNWLSERSPMSAPDTHGGIVNGEAELSPIYTSQVLYWEDDILRWSRERNLNPNLVATIMQIESCGDPYVSSNAGAQGLFQVMPFHFANGENQIDPETNAQRGLNHLIDCLNWTNYDVGVTFACYNGGPSVIGLPQSQWYEESRYYFRWGTGIYNDALEGLEDSPAVEEWLNAGGNILCGQAGQTQALLQPNNN